jgi:iron(III) transport system substrate-binding protein
VALLIRTEDLKGLLSPKEIVDAVEGGYRQWAQGSALRFALRMTSAVVLISSLILGGAARGTVTIEEAIEKVAGLSPNERLARVEGEARKEGIVRWATSTPVTWAEPAIQAFRKRYPTIQMEFNRVSGRALADRAIREYRAGKYDIDVLGSSAVTFWGVREAGVLRPYVSSEAGALNREMKDSKGFWSSSYSNVLAIICNKNRVKSAPKSWKDFVDPKWKGDFSIDTERFQWFYALQKIYGDEEARKSILAYVQNGAQIRRGGTLQAQLVAAGEYACALAVYLDNVHLLLKSGAPVTYSVPEPVLLSPTIIMMPKFPPHPYAAILLYDYLLSPEGLSHFTRNNALFPPRENVAMVDEVKLLKGKPMFFIEVEDSSRGYTKISESYQSLLRK